MSLQSPGLSGRRSEDDYVFRNFGVTVIHWLLVAAITLGCFEVGLRLWPKLVPLSLLREFQKDLRLTIAQQLHLQNYSQVWTFPRDDDGPVLRLFKPFTRLDFEFRDTRGWVPVQLDANGFCNPESSNKTSKIDIIVVGDSFTWCFGLNPQATWGTQLASLTGLTSYIIGRGNTGPYEYLQMLKGFGLRKRPKFVVFNIYEGNDLRDSVLYHKYVGATAAGEILYGDPDDRQSGLPIYNVLLNNVLGRHSYAINFVVTGLGKGYSSLKEEILAAFEGRTAWERVNFHYRLNFFDRSVPFNVYNSDRDEVRHAQWLRSRMISLENFTNALTQFVELARVHGFVPIVSYSPSAYTAYADFVKFEDPALSDLMPWYSSAQREFFRRKAEELGYLFVDITPQLQVAARVLQDKTLLYYPSNVHFTDAGNRLVAEVLAPMITGHTAQ